MAVKYDKILGDVREKDSIPQYNEDPATVKAEDAWVLRTQIVGEGGGIIKAILGLGFPITSAGLGGSLTYQFSYRTKEGSTIRATLT